MVSRREFLKYFVLGLAGGVYSCKERQAERTLLNLSKLDAESLSPEEQIQDAATIPYPSAVAVEDAGLTAENESKKEETTGLEKRIRKDEKLLREQEGGRKCEEHGHEELNDHEKTAWIVYDLKREKEILAINPEIQMQAASTIKPIIGMFNYAAEQRGLMDIVDEELHDAMMELMIRFSDNVASTLLMRLPGQKRLWEKIGEEKDMIMERLERLREHNYRAYCLPSRLMGKRKKKSPKLMQLLMSQYACFQNTNIVEEIDRGGHTYKNKISARDHSRFLQALWKKEFPKSKKLLEFMGMDNYTRLTDDSEIWDGTELYDKTGTTGRACNNAGIIKKGDEEWIFVGLIENPKPNAKWKTWEQINRRARVIQHYSRMTRDYLLKKST